MTLERRLCGESLVNELLGHVLLAAARHRRVRGALVRLPALVPRLLVQNRLVQPLLLLLQLLGHVLVHLRLLPVEDLQTVLERHLALQVVVLAEKLRVRVLAAQLERRDVDALQPLLERLEGLGEGQEHEDTLERLEQVLGVLALPGQLDAQVDEPGRFNQLDKTSKCNEFGCVHLDLGEAGDEAVGQLVVAREQAQRQRADRVRRPRFEQSEEQFFLGAGVLRPSLAHQDGPQVLVLGARRDDQSQSFNELLLEDEIPMVLQLACELHKDLFTTD